MQGFLNMCLNAVPNRGMLKYMLKCFPKSGPKRLSVLIQGRSPILPMKFQGMDDSKMEGSLVQHPSHSEDVTHYSSISYSTAPKCHQPIGIYAPVVLFTGPVAKPPTSAQ